MNNSCDKDDKSCGSNCSEIRKQVRKIMFGFAIVIVALGYYIMSNGLLEKFFK